MKKLIHVFALLLLSFSANAQGEIIDEIVAVVGDNMVLRSEVEKQFELYRREYTYLDDSFRCSVLDELIAGKLLLFKAQLDSMVVEDERVEGEIDRKIRYLADQLGGQTRLEAYLGMTVLEYKAKIKEEMRQQILATDMQNKIIGEVSVSHADIVKYFEDIPEDSLPLINAEYEVGQIVITPEPSQVAVDYAREKIEKLRARVLAGEDFGNLALIYSEDPGSSFRRGELDFFGRGVMAPEFEAAAFKLANTDTISDVIKTQFGFHIIQLVERRGEQINVRHILIRPKLLTSDLERAAALLDSIKKDITAGKITFEDAAKKYSDDESTKSNGGFFTEQSTGSSLVPIEQLDRSVIFSFDNIKAGEISEPIPVLNGSNNSVEGFKIIYLKTELKPHKANLDQDYQKIKAAATDFYEQKALTDWLNDFSKTTYIHIEPEYLKCNSLEHWYNNPTTEAKED